MRRPEILLLIAIWEFITGFLALVGAAAIGLFAIPTVALAAGDGRYFAIVALGFAILLLLTFIALAVGAGVGILLGKEWGRILAIIHAALMCFWVPIGTILGILTIVYLVRPEVREYFVTPQKPGPTAGV